MWVTNLPDQFKILERFSIWLLTQETHWNSSRTRQCEFGNGLEDWTAFFWLNSVSLQFQPLFLKCFECTKKKGHFSSFLRKEEIPAKPFRVPEQLREREELRVPRRKQIRSVGRMLLRQKRAACSLGRPKIPSSSPKKVDLQITLYHPGINKAIQKRTAPEVNCW